MKARFHFGLLMAMLLPTLTWGSAQSPTLERCLTLGENDLRSELRTVTRQFFDAELGAVDLSQMVENKWLELGMPELLQAEVNQAADSVQSDTGLTKRFISSFSPAQATDLAEQVADRAFNADVFRTRLETLANEVATDFTNSFSSVAARSATSATECIQTYLGNAYGDAIASAYGREIQANVENAGTKALTGSFRPDNPALRGSGAGVATIAGSYIARAVAQRLSAQISRRVAGNIATRILGRAGSSVIPVVGWIVGGGLIVWDVVDSVARGPFPTIRRQLAGDETQGRIQQEITASLREDMPTVSSEISAGIANEIFTEWQAFTQSFNSVLELAERNAEFRQELNTTPEIDLYKLTEVIQIVPEAAVLEATQKGELRRVVELPESSLEILETSASIPTVLAWADLAGTQLDDVVDNEVYRYKAPEDFSQRTLERLLETDSAATIERVAALPTGAMNTLLQDLPTANLNALADEFGTAELETVAWYADALPREPFSALVVRLLERPSRLEKFAPDAVRNAVVESRERFTAVALIGSEPTNIVDFPLQVLGDLGKVFDGRVQPRVFLAAYSIGGLLIVAVFLLLSLLIVFWLLTRLVPWRRKRA